LTIPLAALAAASVAQCAEASERELSAAVLQILPVHLDPQQFRMPEAADADATRPFTLRAISGNPEKLPRFEADWPGNRIDIIGLAFTGKGYLGEHEVSASLTSYETTVRSDPRFASALALKAPLAAFGQFSRPGYGLRLIDGDAMPLRQPSFAASISWGLPGAFRLEATHSDTLGDPDLALMAMQGSWQSRSDTISLVTDLSRGWQLRLQSFQGRTIASDNAGGSAWIDTRYGAGSAMISRSFGANVLSARYDSFVTSNRGSLVDADKNEKGWALSVIASRKLGPLAVARAQLVHLESYRGNMPVSANTFMQTQDQAQFTIQVKW
jgi:hypothetical protein